MATIAEKYSMPMKAVAIITGSLLCQLVLAERIVPAHPTLTVTDGPFQPNWESLTNYQCPDWFRDAKFGIWACWTPQCQPEMGDWYSCRMYQEGSKDYKYHLAHYGHPSKFGYKDILPLWKGEHFDADKLLSFYKNCGAKYFMAEAVHCDNFDVFNSKYQPWNSINIGPHKDIIAAWAAAARKLDLRFGVSVHNGGWTWKWYEVAQRADTNGPFAGVPYDGKLTKSDGKGLWWDGYDPQELYEQNHAPGGKPDVAYCEKYFHRTQQLWDDYQPDLIYFDESILPMHRLGVDDAYGLNLYAHFYNSSIQRHGRNEAVITAKILPPLQRRAMVYDIERGKASGILPEPWQTDTCLGDWHYSRPLFEKHQYKTAAQVIPMLVDIVSKNGNLMLSVPVRADGTIDSDETKIVSEIGAWLKINGEAIYGTRPWKIYGEGPSTVAAPEKGGFDGVKDVGSKPFTAEDIRFTTKGKLLYAVLLGWPADGKVTIHSLAEHSPNWDGSIAGLKLLGAPENLKWSRDENGLHLTLPDKKPCATAFTLEISP
jgi:alpha-L-fucosidase